MLAGYHLGHATLVRFQGMDRCRVLNNLCTQDLRKLGDGQALETFVTDVKGRTFGHGIAFALGEEAFFLTVPQQAEKLVPHFDRYIIREDAVVTDQSPAYQLWLFQDRSAMARAFSIELEQTPDIGCAVKLTVADSSILLVHAPWIAPTSTLAILPIEFSDLSLRANLGSDWTESDMTVRHEWESQRIQAMWPWFGVDMDDRNLPQELDRNSLAISFNKGCYLGQETIARLDALGQVQKKLVKIILDSNVPPPSQTVVQYDGKDVGMVCSSAFDASVGKCIGLAYVKRSHFKQGQLLTVNNLSAVVA
jgi:folate-binding protein YgfZ